MKEDLCICLVNGSQWKYQGDIQSIKSAITFYPNIFLSNRTYQWMIQMTNKRNASTQTNGYVLVQIEEKSSELIIIG